ncbi:hypothetical protein Tco_0959755, partial [Tanacetum coccineum]
ELTPTPTPDPEWNKCQVVENQPEQTWFNDLVSAQKDPLTVDELIATPIDFSKFAKNRLKLDKITKEFLVGPTIPKGDRCPFDLSKHLPFKGRLGHLTVPAEYFFSNDLEYLKSENVKRKYTTPITKKKAASYSIEEIMVRRADKQLYTFKKGDFINLHLNDFEDMLLLVVQHKLFHLDGDVIVDLAVALHMFTRSIIIQKRVEYVQLGVESYQKKLNITKPQKDFPTISTK